MHCSHLAHITVLTKKAVTMVSDGGHFQRLGHISPTIFYQSRLMVIGHHPHYHYQLVMLLILWQQQHTLPPHHVLMWMLHHSGIATAMLIFRPWLHLMAQNWPKCKICRKNGGVRTWLFASCNTNYQCQRLFGDVFFNLQANSQLKPEDVKSNHQFTHNNELTNKSEIEMHWMQLFVVSLLCNSYYFIAFSYQYHTDCS